MKWIVRILALLGLVGAVLWVGGRVSDGPIGFFSGGSLKAGDLVTEANIDWSFAKHTQTLEMQLLEPPRSRTLWLLVHRGQLYVPCGVPNFTLWKQWPHEAMQDGRAIIRVDGKRYERSLERVTSPDLFITLRDGVGSKYGGADDLDQESLWFFRLAPR